MLIEFFHVWEQCPGIEICKAENNQADIVRLLRSSRAWESLISIGLAKTYELNGGPIQHGHVETGSQEVESW